MSLPKVAIISLTYNHQRYIEKTVESFKQQNYPNVNFLIFDDCSSDDTYRLSVLAASSDSRVSIIRNSVNLGAALNSQKAVSSILGRFDYIGFCEGDDYLIDSERLFKQVQFLELNKDVSMVFTASNIIDESGDLIRLDSWGDSVRYFDASDAIFIGGNLCATSSTLYRASVIEELPDNFFNYPVGDYPLQMLAAFVGKIAFLPICGSAYRHLSVSSWSQEMKSAEKYLLNHFSTLDMFYDLNKISSGRFKVYFYIAKVKYWYFLLCNNNLSIFLRLTALLKHGRGVLYLLPIVFMAPIFRVVNFIRRSIINRFVRGGF